MTNHEQGKTKNLSSDILMLLTKRCEETMNVLQSNLLTFCLHIAISKCHLEQSDECGRNLAGQGVGQNIAN